MIVFEGELNKRNKLYMLRLYTKSLILSSIFVSIVVVLCAVLPFYRLYSTNGLFMLILIPFALGLQPLLLLLFINPRRIVFDNNSFSLCMGYENKNQRAESFSLDEIESIEEYEDFYLCQTSKKRKFICQKDLLMKGTLEDFAKLFSDKIVDKTC